MTGNFVTLGASLALGTSGALAKLLALPVFCAVVIAVRLLNTVLSNRHWPALEVLITVKVLFLITGAVLAIRFGPFHDADSLQVMIDLADRIYAPKGTESPSSARLVQMSTNILIFARRCSLLPCWAGAFCSRAPR